MVAKAAQEHHAPRACTERALSLGNKEELDYATHYIKRALGWKQDLLAVCCHFDTGAAPRNGNLAGELGCRAYV